MRLTRDLAALESKEFDVVVVGGGISGACVAHDAALRGLSVALVERRDFGAATSAASSKVLHGGIRHLQRLELGKLRESALERCCFQRVAPHLTHYVPFLIPTYQGLAKGPAALWTAVRLHELLSAGQNAMIHDPSKRVPRSRICTKAETLALAPVLGSQRHLVGSCMIHESHMHSSERMTLAFVKSAASNGAVVANYVGAERLLLSGHTARGVSVRDQIGGAKFDIRARVVVNAAGPWMTELNRAFGLAGSQKTVTGFSKGIHLITQPVLGGVALVLPTTKQQVRVVDRGGRHLFFIPWRNLSLIGTSNVPFNGSPNDVRATEQDITDFLGDINSALPGLDLSVSLVRHSYAGLYPLTADVIHPDVYQATGTYQVCDHERLGTISRLVSVLATKYTTARRLAELGVDLVLQKLGQPGRPSNTRTTPLVGGAIDHLPTYLLDAQRRYSSRLDSHVIAYLVGHYGTEIDALLNTTAEGVNSDVKLSASRESIEAEVVFAVTSEMALHLDDVVFRRTGLGTIGHPGATCLRRCAHIMADRLGWSLQQTEDELGRTEALLTLPVASAA